VLLLLLCIPRDEAPPSLGRVKTDLTESVPAIIFFIHYPGILKLLQRGAKPTKYGPS
jgi:hypothetical protein